MVDMKTGVMSKIYHNIKNHYDNKKMNKLDKNEH